MALILVGYGNHLIPDWLQVAFLIHSHYDWLWQIIHYNRYQQPVLVHCTILWQGRDKMAPKCDVIMTTVAWISYSRERERWQRNQVQQKHLKITGRKKKEKRVQYLRQESFGVQVQRLAESHSVINRWINCCWSGWWGGPQAGGGLRARMR